MGGVEGQRLHALLPQVQQQAGVHHGHREAAQLVAVAGGEVLGRAAVVALQGREGSILPVADFSANKPVMSREFRVNWEKKEKLIHKLQVMLL